MTQRDSAINPSDPARTESLTEDDPAYVEDMDDIRDHINKLYARAIDEQTKPKPGWRERLATLAARPFLKRVERAKNRT